MTLVWCKQAIQREMKKMQLGRKDIEVEELNEENCSKIKTRRGFWTCPRGENIVSKTKEI